MLSLRLIKKIAHREGKIGDLLALGVKQAAQEVGKGSEKFAIQVKGMEQSAYATHNATAMLLAYMTCDVGAHHNRSWAITYDLQVGREKVVPEKVARVIWLQNFRPMFDVMGSCRLQWVELGIDRDLYCPVLGSHYRCQTLLARSGSRRESHLEPHPHVLGARER